MFRIILIGILLFAGNAYAQNSCSEETWNNAKKLYERGKLYEDYMSESNDVLCLSNPDCVHYQSKDNEVQKLEKIKGEALNKFYQAQEIYQWIATNCGFKLSVTAKTSLSSVNGSIEKIDKQFKEMSDECLMKANKISNSFTCN